LALTINLPQLVFAAGNRAGENTDRLHLLIAFINLHMGEKHLLVQGKRVRFPPKWR